jgi:hypothetical protein
MKKYFDKKHFIYKNNKMLRILNFKGKISFCLKNLLSHKLFTNLDNNYNLIVKVLINSNFKFSRNSNNKKANRHNKIMVNSYKFY